MKRDREKRVARRTRSPGRPPVEGNKPVLGCDEEGDDAPDAARDFEEGIEDAIDDVVGRFRDLSEMRKAVLSSRLRFDVVVE